MSERISALQGMPIFGGLAAATLESILSKANHLSRSNGQHFFREGEIGQTMYVIEKGRVGVYKSSNQGGILLRTLEMGDCSGEMALMDLMPRTASTVAMEDCEALEINGELLHEMSRENLEQFVLLQMNMGREVARRLRTADDELFRAFTGAAQPGELVKIQE